MPLFFIVSGFLYERAYFSGNDIKTEKLKTQMMNLICIYVIYSLILGGTKIIFGGFVNNQVRISDLLLIPIKPIQLYWYLYVLVIYYFVFSRSIVYRQSSTILLSITLALTVLSYWIPETVPCEAKRLVYHGFFFCSGITMSKKHDMIGKKHLGLLQFPVILLLFLLFWNNAKNLNDIFIVNSILGIGCSWFIWEMFGQYKILGENRILSYIGKNSLEIYLLHSFVLTAARAVFHGLNINNELLIILFSTATGVVIPILISQISKRIKVYRLLFSPYKTPANK